jgi:hypothetical protein
MRISARAFLQSTLLSCLTVGLLVGDAVAGPVSPVSVNFGGKVTSALPNDSFPGNVQVPDIITNNSAFGYNSGQAGVGGKYIFTGTTQTLSLQVSTPGFPTTTWSDGYAGSPALYMVTMTKSGSTTKMDLHVATSGGTAEAGSKTNAAVDLILTSTTYTGGTTLPNATTISSFLLTPASLVWDPPGAQGEPGQGFNGFINVFNGTTVPEPSSLVLGIVALATCSGGFLITRRRAARAARKA